MTVICAVNDLTENCVWIGCNDCATIGNLISPSIDSKWIHIDDWLIGACGNGPLSEAVLSARKDFPPEKADAIQITNFIREAFSNFDIGETEDGYKRYSGSGMLVHKSGLVYEYDTTSCLTEVPPNVLWARGSATDMAVGASRALEEFLDSRQQLITKTIEIVIKNDLDCPGNPLIKRFTRRGELLDE